MKRKTIIILSIFSIIFSLLYVLLNYFGFIRYISLYIHPIENYEKSYKKLDKIGKFKTIINLIPDNTDSDIFSIKSLLDQTVKVDNITIIIPKNSSYILSDKLKKYVNLYKCENDNGKLNCLIPSILTENESDTRIITLKTDTIYGKDFLELLLSESEKNPEKIVFSNDSDFIDVSKGVVFVSNFFKEDFLNLSDKSNIHINNYFKNKEKFYLKYKENFKKM